MKNNRLIANLQRRMKEMNTNPQAVSKAAKLGDTYVRDIIEGRAHNPRPDTLGKVARVLETTYYELLEGEPPRRAGIPLRGYAGARDRVNILEGEQPNPELIDAPELDADDWEAVIVRGRSMEPVYRDRDVLFYRNRQHHPQSVLNLDCIVETERGRRYIKLIRPGRTDACVDLESYARVDTIRDVTPEWIAPIEIIRRALR